VIKDFMKRAKSFITLDFLFQAAYVSKQFANMQRKLQTEIPGWSNQNLM